MKNTSIFFFFKINYFRTVVDILKTLWRYYSFHMLTRSFLYDWLTFYTNSWIVIVPGTLLLTKVHIFIQISLFFTYWWFLFQDHIQDNTLCFIVISSQASLRHFLFSVILRILRNTGYFIECPSVWIYLIFLSWLEWVMMF